MGFKAGKVIKGDIPLDKVGPLKGLPTFTSDELMFLIQYMGESKFQGKDVEMVYKVIWKLQELFLYYQKLNNSKK